MVEESVNIDLEPLISAVNALNDSVTNNIVSLNSSVYVKMQVMNDLFNLFTSISAAIMLFMCVALCIKFLFSK